MLINWQTQEGERFAMMDIKLALAMQTMLRNSPDDAKDVVHDVQMHAERRQRGHRVIKGREIIAIVLQSFRSSDRSGLLFTIEHLIKVGVFGARRGHLCATNGVRFFSTCEGKTP